MSTVNIKCDCGKTEFTVDTEKVQVTAFCHCDSCQKVATSPMVEVIVVTPDAISMIKEDELQKYDMVKKKMIRHYCGACGNVLWNTNKFDLCVMAAANYRKNGLEMEQFKPKFHLMYEERLHDCTDDLPKFLNFPEAFGGDGKTFEESKEGSEGACSSCVIS